MKIKSTRAVLCFCIFFFALRLHASESIIVWTNTLGGYWNNAYNWSPNHVPFADTDSVMITNSGTYTVVVTNAAHAGSGLLGGAGSGTRTLVVDNGATLDIPLFLHIQTNGILVLSNAIYQGQFIVETNGQLWLEGTGNKSFTGTILYNYGSVFWRDGNIFFGGSVGQIQNYGLWQIDGDHVMTQSGMSGLVLTNYGTVRKTSTAGVNVTKLTLNLVNTGTGLVDVQAGTINMFAGTNNILGGSFNTAAGAALNFLTGTFYDDGGVFTGAGISQFLGHTLNLRTNNLPGLKLVYGGHVVLGPDFQHSGYITNLTLDGAILDGTNHVRYGTLTVNSGGFGAALDVQPEGQLVLASPATKSIVGATLINQGTVTWTDGTIAWGSGTILNSGVWDMQSDDQFYRSSGTVPTFINGGTFIKTGGGADMSRIEGMNFTNNGLGVVQVDAGTLRMPQNYTNTGGTLRLNGGTLGASIGSFNGFGTMYLNGGTLEGTGLINSLLNVSGGTISPGASPGLLQFSSGLTMTNGSVLKIDGSGTAPGSGYDQLSVTGAVNLAGCTLQVTSLPAVPSGTTFTIVQNDAADAVQGTFDGLAENSIVNVGADSYRLHYAGITGNDVVLVNESGPPPIGVSLSNGGYGGGAFHLIGSGSSSIPYTIQATTNFIQWTNIGLATGDVSGAFNFVDTNASKFPRRFYRTTN